VNWQFSLAGLLVGVLVGLTGMGGGSLMTPILILLFGFNAKVAVGTDILHGAVFKSFGAIRHRQLGTVHARLACWMLVGSAPLSLVGVELSNKIGDNSMSNLQKIVGGALIVGGAGFLAKTFINAKSDNSPLHLSTRDKLIAIAIGAFGGFVVGLTSVGSGTFFGLAMLFAYPLTAPKMVGTDMFHAAVLLWVAGISHLLHGDVDTHAMAWLLVGSIPGVLIGSNLAIRVPARSLRVGFGAVLLLSGIKLVNTPDANYAIAAVLGLGALALAAWLVREYRLRQARLRRVAPQEAA
jgi:uncharacterized membrane protein YfcA